MSSLNSLLLNTAPEVRGEIYKRLEVQDVLALNETCKDWHFETHGLSNPSLWQFLFNRDFPKYPKPSSNAQKHYEVHFVRRANLNTGAHAQQILNARTAPDAGFSYGIQAIDGIRSLCLENGQLISGSSGGAIQVWDLQTGKRMRQLAEYINGDHYVDSMSVIDKKLFVCRNGKLRIDILDLQTGKELGELKGHALKVNCLITAQHTLISGSNDTTIKIWDPKTERCVTTFEGHESSVTCLCLADEKLVSSSTFDGIIKIWDLNTKTCLNTFKSEAGVESLCFFDEHIFARSYQWGTPVWVWEATTGHFLHTLNFTTGYMGNDHTAVIGEHLFFPADNSVHIWNSNTGKHVSIGEKAVALTHLLSSEGKFVYGLKDGRIGIWDFDISQDALLSKIANQYSAAAADIDKEAESLDALQARARKLEALDCFMTQIPSQKQLTIAEFDFTDDKLAQKIQAYLDGQEVISRRPPIIPCVALSVDCDVGYGNSLVICGSGGDLSWHRSQGKPLHWREGKWVIQVPANVKAFKLVKVTKHGRRLWEKGDNRILERSRLQSIADVRF